MNTQLRIKSHAYSRKSQPHSFLKTQSGESSLGVILLAQNERGLCAIFLGDNQASLLEELKVQFPSAKILQDQATCRDRVELLCRYADKPKHNLDLDAHLDLQGTAFQLRVWQAIKGIPAGQTLSYKEVAKRIQHPNAYRAVAQACSKNMIALAIPCHRVIGQNGNLCGYRWGIHRKEILLESEKHLCI